MIPRENSLAAVVPSTTGNATERPIVDEMIRCYLDELKESLELSPVGNRTHMGYSLALAWSLNHPENPFTGDSVVLERAADACDAEVEVWESAFESKGVFGTNEWNALTSAYCDVTFREAVPAARRAPWRRLAVEYCEGQMQRPFFYTAFNHEISRCVTLYRVGELYERKDFKERGTFLARQLLEFVTPHGFWEEGTHHGPSMRYNFIMLPGLAWMFRLTGDEGLRAATEKLADFMSRFSFPDGSPVGAFDGRLMTASGAYMKCYAGLEFTPMGRALMARRLDAFQQWRRTYPGTSFHARHYHHAQSVEYFLRFGAPEGASTALPLDASDRTVESHTPYFDGLAVRRGPWVVALSGQQSDIPKEAPDRFRLERQSRIELWNEARWVCLGGGHSSSGGAVPLANAVVYTGHGDVDLDFGRIEGRQGNEWWDRVNALATYHVRAARTCMDGGTPTLELHFAHASFRFQVQLEADRAVIHWSVEQAGAQRLLIQIPVMVLSGGRLEADGLTIPPSGGPVPIEGGAVRVENPFGSFSVRVTSEQGRTKLRYPYLPPVEGKETVAEPHSFVGLLSTQIDSPPPSLKGRWTVESGT